MQLEKSTTLQKQNAAENAELRKKNQLLQKKQNKTAVEIAVTYQKSIITGKIRPRVQDLGCSSRPGNQTGSRATVKKLPGECKRENQEGSE